MPQLLSIRSSLWNLALVTAALLTANLAGAQEGNNLSLSAKAAAQSPLMIQASIRRIRTIEEKHFFSADRSQFRKKAIPALADTPAGKAKLFAVSGGHFLRPSDPADVQFRSVMITRYEYATGLTFETVIDLNERKVTSFTAFANAPTTLTETEIGRALKIAARDFPELKTRRPKFWIHPFLMADTQSPLYGHRLVTIGLRRANVDVDLTTGKILERDKPRSRLRRGHSQPPQLRLQ
ncbi:MAG: hypothetical protein HY053_09805 [Proteobacteria bacterium]|nr:hypothetical protein [Pseudomonadota bacterium]